MTTSIKHIVPSKNGEINDLYLEILFRLHQIRGVLANKKKLTQRQLSISMRPQLNDATLQSIHILDSVGVIFYTKMRVTTVIR